MNKKNIIILCIIAYICFTALVMSAQVRFTAHSGTHHGPITWKATAVSSSSTGGSTTGKSATSSDSSTHHAWEAGTVSSGSGSGSASGSGAAFGALPNQ
ncbi:cysteine protease 4 [Tieghemostelium lacteum]|uniref:Cysteine protease 4 n=1 Tax=Tieghemostelium lacteum TaxID=361077 RepID=A0A151Z751_TIELA|nr:cysteine protease 4 [Tieghemostelium lacteum]|eukprot:KYQ89757.1 cysteine protease 4 [Tieghemostelium lacteum]